MSRIIGIAGVARSGKDSLYKWLETIDLGMPVKRISLGDVLKKELDEFFKAKYGISAFTTDLTEKELVRDCFVSFAHVVRWQSNGRYFTSKIQPKVDAALSSGFIPVITDIRFAEFEGSDELDWLIKQNGLLIHVSKTDKTGNLVLPPNPTEAKNDPKLFAAAHYAFTWPTLDSLEEMDKWLKNENVDLILKNLLTPVSSELTIIHAK